jgi:hypothetical protein
MSGTKAAFSILLNSRFLKYLADLLLGRIKESLLRSAVFIFKSSITFSKKEFI